METILEVNLKEQKICNIGCFDIIATKYSVISAIKYKYKHATTANNSALPKEGSC